MRGMSLTRCVVVALFAGALACARNQETGTAVVQDSTAMNDTTGQVQNPPGAWVSGSGFSWISSTLSGSGGGGSYLFVTFIDLSGYDPATASLTFNCALDNFAQNGGAYSLNDGAYTGACGVFNFGPTQTISSGWLSGINELRFWVGGDNTTDGLAVGNASITATAVTATPEPATLALMATGLVLVGVVRRRTSQG